MNRLLVAVGVIVMLVCTVYVDFDKDGSFTTSGDDISAYWKSTSIAAGMRTENDHVANVGVCTLVLNNEGREFSPLNTGSTYYGKMLPGLDVKVDYYDTVTYDTGTIFRGTTQTWRPSSGHIHGNWECELVCADFMETLRNAPIEMTLQQDTTGDVLLGKVCAEAGRGEVATGSISITPGVANGETVTVGTTVYTFETTLAGVDNGVLLNTTIDNARNLAAAINADTGAGTLYENGTERHADVTAEVGYAEARPQSDRTTYGQPSDAYSIAQPFLVESRFEDFVGPYLDLKKIGSPVGTLTIRIETDDHGQPSGTLVHANATASIDAAGVTTSANVWTQATMSAFDLEGGFYHLVIDSTVVYDATFTDYVGAGIWGDTTTPEPYAMGYEDISAGKWWYKDGAYYYALIFDLPGEITITANARGTWGNSIALSDTSGSITVSGATLSGGTDAPSGLQSFETGVVTFTYAADGWTKDSTNGLSAALDIALSEHGYIFVQRDGTVTFKNRDWLFEQQLTAASLDLVNHPDSCKGTIDIGDIRNSWKVRYAPRAEQTAGIIAVCDDVVKVPGRKWFQRHSHLADVEDASNVVITVPYIEDDIGKTVGATGVIAPVETTDPDDPQDYEVVRVSDAGATLITGKVTLSLAVKATGIDVAFSSSAYATLKVKNLQIRGSSIRVFRTQEVSAADSTSIGAYGLREGTYSIPLPSTYSHAQSIARYRLGRYKDAVYRVPKVSFRGTTSVNGTHLYSLDLFNIVTLTDTQTGLDEARYMIIGWRCQISHGDSALEWDVRRIDDRKFMIVDHATLGKPDGTTYPSI